MYGVLYSLVYKLFHNIGYFLFAGIGVVVLTFDHISWPVPILIPGPGIGSKAEYWQGIPGMETGINLVQGL
jgi:hypothetical protein